MAAGIMESNTKTSMMYRKRIDFVRSEITSTKRELDSDSGDEHMETKKPRFEACSAIQVSSSHGREELPPSEGSSRSEAFGLNVFGNKISHYFYA